jgi:hypothetical protein
MFTAEGEERGTEQSCDTKYLLFTTLQGNFLSQHDVAGRQFPTRHEADPPTGLSDIINFKYVHGTAGIDPVLDPPMTSKYPFSLSSVRCLDDSQARRSWSARPSAVRSYLWHSNSFLLALLRDPSWGRGGPRPSMFS